MTTYRFSRASSHSFSSSVQVAGYLKFMGLGLVAFLLDFLNIPSFFGGEYHIFLFDTFLFFYLFLGRSGAPKYLTIFVFYALIDILNLNYIGISFLSFAISLLAVKFLSLRSAGRERPELSGFIAFAFLFFYLLLFVFFKLFFMWALMDFTPSLKLLLFLLKSIFYTSLLFINLYLILPSKRN